MIEHFEHPKYQFLSNFFECVVEFNGNTFSSVEHAYQSAKNDNVEWLERCKDSRVPPWAIKKESKEVKLRVGWNGKKIDIMRECLTSKFSIEPLKTMLLQTGDEHIQEGNWHGDKFWGVCMEDGKGKNMLGKLLMDVRSNLELEPIF